MHLEFASESFDILASAQRYELNVGPGALFTGLGSTQLDLLLLCIICFEG